MGLLVGLLGGAVAAVLKAVQARSTSTPAPVTPAPWTPIPDAPPVVVPPKPAAAPAPAAAPRPRTSIADLQEAPAAAPATKKKAPAKKAAPKPKDLEPWVEPVDGECPPTHPVKGKMSSKIYHLPGGFNYARTRPDRCYVDAAAAEADGLRPAKR